MLVKNMKDFAFSTLTMRAEKALLNLPSYWDALYTVLFKLWSNMFSALASTRKIDHSLSLNVIENRVISLEERKRVYEQLP